jgi:hypothetical protein
MYGKLHYISRVKSKIGIFFIKKTAIFLMTLYMHMVTTYSV